MKWFKFYGQDFLTDSKMRILTVEEKMCWVVLMCLANSEDKDGKILFLNEDEVMKQAGIEYDTPMWSATKGFLDKFVELRMIEIDVTNVTQGVTQSNKAVRYDVTLTNFDRRQTENLSNAERQKRHREKLKEGLSIKTKVRNDSNVTQRNDSNARIDKNRIEKNIHNIQYGELKKVSLASEEYERLVDLFGQTGVDVLIFELDTYIASSGKKYKSHYATLLNWAKRKFDQKQLQTKGRGLAQ